MYPLLVYGHHHSIIEIRFMLDYHLRAVLLNCRPSRNLRNLVLVTKKGVRRIFAIANRRLNSLPEKYVYGIPLVQTILDKLHHLQFFSVIDISAP